MRGSRRPFAVPPGLAALPLALLLLAMTAPAAAQRQGAAAVSPPLSPAAPPVAGRVVDAETGAGVEGAEVRLEGSSLTTVTDARGGWQLPAVPVGSHVVTARHIGYGTTTRRVQVPASGEVRLEVQPRVIPLGAVVVTGSRRAQRLADAPVPTELIPRAVVERTGASDVAAVLTEQTGIQLHGGHPSGTGVMLQGLDAERVLVLLDGQPLVGRLSGTLDLSRIPASMVERIEVVKGPQSTLYGSEAMGGVVNIVTQDAGGDWRASTLATAGSQGRWDGHGQVAGSVGSLDVLAEGGRRRTEVAPGRSSTAGALSARTDGLGKLGWSAGDVALDASLMLVDERQQWRTGQLYHFADNTQWSGRIGAQWSTARHRLAPTLYASVFDHLARTGTRETPPPPETGSPQQQRLLEAELVYGYVRGDLAVDAGVEIAREGIRGESIQGDERELTSVQPYLQLPFEIGPVSLVPGVRWSWSEQWGTHWTPRLAALWRPVEPLAIRVSAGRGFRAPSFKELYMDFLNAGAGFAYAVRGNAELEPETSTNVTAAVEWAGTRFYGRAQLFRNDFDRFIETRLVGDSSGVDVYTYGNIADGVTEGLEAEVGTAWRGLRVEAGYAWLRAEDRATGRALLGRPAHSARLLVGQQLPTGTRVSVSGTHTGATPIDRDEQGDVITRDGFLRFDLRLAQPVRPGVRLAAGVDNVLDELPQDWPGYAGRQLYVSLMMDTGGLFGGADND